MSRPPSTFWGRLKRLFCARAGCDDVDQLLFDYSEGQLDPKTKQRIDEHLKDCPLCLKYLETYHATIAATHQHCCHKGEMPPELRQKLQQFITQKL